MNEQNPRAGSAFQSIRAIDYTVIFARDMAAMRRFYEDILGFALLRELSPGWIEYRLGENTLALARPGLTAADVPTPKGSASLQLAFKVSTSRSTRPAPAENANKPNHLSVAASLLRGRLIYILCTFCWRAARGHPPMPSRQSRRGVDA